MAENIKVICDRSDIVAIADAVRNKTGQSNEMTLGEIVNGINKISVGDTRVKSINHRGYSVGAPENTLPAYRMSKEKGFTYVECDVAFTSDGYAVLLHDGTINRTSSGSGSISSMTFSTARGYDYGSWFSTEYAGTKIPLFSEFIILCKHNNLHPYIELKSSGAYTEAQIQGLVSIVNNSNMQGKVTWISFSSAFLSYVASADPTARLGYLVTSVTDSVISTANGLKTGTNEVFIDSSDYGVDAIEHCRRANLPLEVWTINDEATILSPDEYITGVTSDSLIVEDVLRKASLDVSDTVFDIDMSNGQNVGGSADYNGTLIGSASFQSGKLVIDNNGALTVPAGFMTGKNCWTIAFAIDSYAINSAKTYNRVARGSADVPSIFAIGKTGKFMFKLARGTVFESNLVIYDSDFLTESDGAGTNTALTFIPPTNSRTVFVIVRDASGISLWVNGSLKAIQPEYLYTSSYYASTFSIGDNQSKNYDMLRMECSMLKAWTRALNPDEIAAIV